MALLFAENGVNVSLSDPAEEMMDSVIEKAEKVGYHNKVKKFKGGKSFPCNVVYADSNQTINLCATHCHNPAF